MKRLTIMTLIVATASGCNLDLDFKNKQKAEAHQRWNRARAQVTCGVAAEYFKSGQLDRARAQTLGVLELDGDYLPARVLLAKIMLEQGQYALTIQQLEKAQALDPNSAEIHYLLGVAREKRGEHAAALADYQKARALDSANPAYVRASAEVLVEMGQPRRALELVEARMIEGDPDVSMLALAGELAGLVGAPAKAAEYFQRCLDIDPQRPAFQEELAKAHFFAARHDEAAEALEKLVALPAYQGKAAWAYLMLGQSYEALRRPQQARGAYETATAVAPDDAQAWLGLSRAAAAGGDRTYAILTARRALALKPNNLDATVLLGYMLLREGQAGEAAELLTAAAGKHPDDPTLRCTLGRCYAALGQTDRAVACYVQALRSDPKHQLARTLLAEAGLDK